MASHDISEERVPVAFEDKFLVFAFGRGQSLCPHLDYAHHLGAMIYRLQDRFTSIVPVFDLRGLEGYYGDVDDFIRSVGGNSAHVLIGKREVDAEWEHMLERAGLVPIRAKGKAQSTGIVKAEYFDPGAEVFFNQVLSNMSLDPSYGEDILGPRYEAIVNDAYNADAQLGLDYFDAASEEQLREATVDSDYQAIGNAAYDAQLEELYRLLQSLHSHSLLIEFAMSVVGDQIEVTPYHSHAIHEIETKGDSLVVGRPGVVARATGAVFSDEIRTFERLINTPHVKELQLQRFLEQHPNFLGGLNYQNIYPQIVLEREGSGSLKPDFILEPFDEAFCDILDIKLPSQRIVVGRKDRATLAAGLHEVAAQLREYAAYFEQEKHRKMVHEKYGLRLYRPRLIAIVGRDMKQMSQEQIRRAITCYDNLQFMTFDELLRHTKRRLLI